MTSTMKDDRVRCNTSNKVNEKIDRKTIENINKYSKSPDQIQVRIFKLHKEWDIERFLEMNSSFFSFVGVMLGYFIHLYWLFIPMVILPLLFLHSIQGWCPPLPILRRLNVRTQTEIDHEIMALKILRGDFEYLISKTDPTAEEILSILRK